MFPGYLAGMFYLKESDPTTWKLFQVGNFSLQKYPIPFTVIGWDHTGEQENKKLKINGGLKAISPNLNARTRFFLNGTIFEK